MSRFFVARVKGGSVLEKIVLDGGPESLHFRTEPTVQRYGINGVLLHPFNPGRGHQTMINAIAKFRTSNYSSCSGLTTVTR